ncbi:MAG: serine hydrolase [Pseudomonadota bacterium]
MMLLQKISAIVILGVICLLYSLPSQAQSVVVPMVTGKINRNANFNTKAWSKAVGFTEFATPNGAVPNIKTIIYLMHDQHNLYVGFKCYGQDPKTLVSNARYLPNGDAVFFTLDTFHDGLAAYAFGSNPKADKMSGSLSDYSSSLRFAFAANYKTASQLTPYGYNVEMIIPFKDMPYRQNKNGTIMGFRAVRITHSGQEFDYPYVMYDRQGGSLIQYVSIMFMSLPPSTYNTKPWFSINAIAKARQKLATGYNLNTFVGRSRGWGVNDGSVADYRMFPSHKLHPSKQPKPLKTNLKTKWVAQQFNDIDFYPNRPIGNLTHFLKRTQTTAFIVVHNGKIIYEKYFNGSKQSSIAPSFSMAKSILSALIGIAINKKQIHSINDPITEYLPALLKRDKRFSRITIKDLLEMSSGIRMLKGKPYQDFRRAYFSPNLRYVLLHTLKIVEPAGRHFLYSDYCAQLAGLILTHATHKSATQLLQQELWNPLGMEYGGSWSIDSKKDNLEQLAVGINVPAIEYAKFGLLFLNNGKWDNKQIIPVKWVKASTQPSPVKSGYYPDWGTQRYYKYFWWGLKRVGRTGNGNDYLAIGHRGQYLYVSPQKHLVIVRTGISPGIGDDFDWAKVFYQFATKL